MLKRFCVFIFSLSFLFVGCGNALASIDTEIQTSQTILKYAASVSAGTKNGQIKVSYNISSRGVASSIGISSIKIYATGEGCKATILGTTSNGLLANNTAKKAGTYTYSGDSGTSYYAVVTFTATVNGTSDWKTVTTNTVKAP